MDFLYCEGTYSFWRESRADQVGTRDCRSCHPLLSRFSLSLVDLHHVAHSPLWKFSLSYSWNSSSFHRTKLICFLYAPLKNLWPERWVTHIKIRGLKQQSHLDICSWNRYSKYGGVSVIPLKSKSTLEALKNPIHITHPVSDLNVADQQHPLEASTPPQGMTIISSNWFSLGGCWIYGMGCWSSEPCLGGPLRLPSQAQLMPIHCHKILWMLQTPALTPAKIHKCGHDLCEAHLSQLLMGGGLNTP